MRLASLLRSGLWKGKKPLQLDPKLEFSVIVSDDLSKATCMFDMYRCYC